VLVHELGEVVGRVLPPSVLGQQRVEVGHHLPDGLHSGRILAGESLFHARELRVEDLPPQQVEDVLPVLLTLGAAPLVVVQLAHLSGGVVGERVEVHLGEAGVVAVPAGQELTFRRQCLVELLADLVQGAREVATTLDLAAPAGQLPAQLVQARAVAETPAHEALHRLAQ
jgi:hypothetical protein